MLNAESDEEDDDLNEIFGPGVELEEDEEPSEAGAAPAEENPNDFDNEIEGTCQILQIHFDWKFICLLFLANFTLSQLLTFITFFTSRWKK